MIRFKTVSILLIDWAKGSADCLLAQRNVRYWGMGENNEKKDDIMQRASLGSCDTEEGSGGGSRWKEWRNLRASPGCGTMSQRHDPPVLHFKSWHEAKLSYLINAKRCYLEATVVPPHVLEKVCRP